MWNRILFPNEVRVAGALAAIIVAACARESPPPARDTGRAAAAASQRRATTSDTTCPQAGAWLPCNVLDRLERAGLVVQKQSEPARVPMFSVEGSTYTTSVSTIYVFLYPDEAARRRDTDRLDSATVAPRGATYTWSDPAVLVTSNNLAAVVVSPNERQSERIVLALGAGLPARE